MALSLGQDRIAVADVCRVAREGESAMLGAAAAARMLAAQAVLQAWSRADRPVYGLTRGLGNRATSAIAAEDRGAFSVSMLKARASGAGPRFPPTRSCGPPLFVRAATLAQGGAGARPVIVETQLAMLDRGVVPLRSPESARSVPRTSCSAPTSPCRSSVSAGRPSRASSCPGTKPCGAPGIATVALTEKEGLALCSSNAVSVGFGALVAADAMALLDLAEAALAMSYEAFVGNPSPFDARIAAAHPAAGQVEAAARLRALLAGSALFRPGVPRRVQDPISFRCATHVQGAASRALGWARDAIEVELNAAADNPLILAQDDEILSTGNFHTAAMGIAFDALRLALAQVGTISAQRTARLLDPEVSGLAARSVTRSGFGLLGLLGHTLNRESRDCSTPVSNDDATPFGVEDQAPFTLQAVRRTAAQIAILQQVLACEMIVAAQALDMRPLVPSAPTVQALHAFVRRHVSCLDEDRATTEDVERLTAAIRDGKVKQVVEP